MTGCASFGLAALLHKHPGVLPELSDRRGGEGQDWRAVVLCVSCVMLANVALAITVRVARCRAPVSHVQSGVQGGVRAVMCGRRFEWTAAPAVDLSTDRCLVRFACGRKYV